MSKTETKSKSSISHKLAQLDEAVEWFYGDEFSLDDALKKYESASKLAHDIKEDLSKLRNQVEVVEDFTRS